ncbi:MAG: hypothetical protein M0Z55_06655 [Peptococcaceae bacterium]|nr:hypothetical protein [Peptococcaceae bacterium]
MLKSILSKGFIQVYRALFVAAFVALNLVGLVFLGAIAFYLIF